MEMKRVTAAILLMLVAGSLSGAIADDGVDTIRLPSQGRGVAGHDADATVAAGAEDTSPWKCCDLSRCTRSMPPSCSCLDKVKKCSKTCKNCEKAVGSNDASSGYYCRDTYGKVAPPCTNKTVTATGVRPVTTGRAEAVSEKRVADGVADASPWKCCDLSRCTRSMPPSCSCLDKVKKCAKTCKNCEKAVGSKDASFGYYCRDTYGKVAPPCTKSVGADVRRGN